MKELNKNELKEISGGHCICHCSIKPNVDPLVSGNEECNDWCRTTGHGLMISCDGWASIRCTIL